ncbi:MAG: FHA domain-containing protein [Chloroflexi bacterium]|nr:FHA domain-containing protein [Chloroflexota bacterium]MBM3174942.1 FHA domain-containing protein [Chloroflexota bacterium]
MQQNCRRNARKIQRFRSHVNHPKLGVTSESGQYYVNDHSSTNGTKVNGSSTSGKTVSPFSTILLRAWARRYARLHMQHK